MIKLLVFDFDGTIADSKKLYIDSIYHSIKKYGYHLSKAFVEKNLGSKLDASLFNMKIKRNAEKIANEVNAFVTKKASSLKLCPYVLGTLAKIKKRKIKTVLMTNSTKKFINAFMKKYPIRKYFNKVLGAEDFLVKEDAFRKLFRQYHIKPNEVVYIADKVKDVKIARYLGIHPLIVLACSWDKKRFKKEPYIVKDFSSII
jgi:phosphoglycolate phosphatase-like HAD superfamily hydrolase